MNSAMPIANVSALLEENESLKLQIMRLEDELRFLKEHKALAAGLNGETIINGLIAGQKTSYAASIDLVTVDGTRIEIKYSKVNVPVSTAPTKRWNWSNVLGNSGNKIYDFLILVGDRDFRYKDFYLDPDCPYVLFCIPFESVKFGDFTVKTNFMRSIVLGTNPKLKRRSKGSILFDRFQISASDLSERFDLGSAERLPL